MLKLFACSKALHMLLCTENNKTPPEDVSIIISLSLFDANICFCAVMTLKQQQQQCKLWHGGKAISSSSYIGQELILLGHESLFILSLLTSPQACQSLCFSSTCFSSAPIMHSFICSILSGIFLPG